MSERQAGPYDSIARKWLALVERRQQHFIELCDTGRWRHYYTQAEFLEEMRKVLRLRDQWAAIAGLPLSDELADDGDGTIKTDDGVLARAGRFLRQIDGHAAERPGASFFSERANTLLPATPWFD